MIIRSKVSAGCNTFRMSNSQGSSTMHIRLNRISVCLVQNMLCLTLQAECSLELLQSLYAPLPISCRSEPLPVSARDNNYSRYICSWSFLSASARICCHTFCTSPGCLSPALLSLSICLENEDYIPLHTGHICNQIFHPSFCTT